MRTARPVVPAALVFCGLACQCTTLMLSSRDPAHASAVVRAAQSTARYRDGVPIGDYRGVFDRLLAMGEAIRRTERTGGAVIFLPTEAGAPARAWLNLQALARPPET